MQVQWLVSDSITAVNKILVTGANGFVGNALCQTLGAQGHNVVSAVRQSTRESDFEHGCLTSNSDWMPALRGCDSIVHLAARVHQIHENPADAAAAYRDMNVAVTLNLARQAISAGVSRFVFVSSIKVNGETSGSRPFSPANLPRPEDAYGLSKWEAEQGLRNLSGDSGMELVIVRPPLVYGPGVRANFLRLLNLVHAGVPLPLGMVKNPRSLVSLYNLVDFLGLCVRHPNAAGKVWMVSDQQDVNIADLIRLIAAAMGKSARLLPIPPVMLAGLASFLGKKAITTRLLDALQVDSTAANTLLDWAPVMTVEEGISRTVAHFLVNRKT